jgi:hypothetical protein
MIFNMSTSYFHKISIHYFEDYLMTKLTLETNLRVRHMQLVFLGYESHEVPIY